MVRKNGLLASHSRILAIVPKSSVNAVWEEEVKLRGVGFVKQVGFKPGVKERGFNVDQVIL